MSPPDPPWPGMAHREVAGRIRYTSRKAGVEGQARGFEDFRFTHHSDGRVTMRAHCCIEEPAPTVMRDIIYSLDADGHPFDCLVRLTVGDRFMGSGLIQFERDRDLVHCTSHGPSIGRLHQTLPIGEGLDGFGTHPIVGDAYMTRCMDIARGPHRRTIRCLLPSPDHRGATPPMLAEVRIGLEYVGDEPAECPAGRFDCHHFRFIDDEGPGMGGTTHPAYDLWVTADSDRIFVKGGVGGYMATWYELVSLSR
ncbi:MAG: hypothetical protein ACK4Z0_00110 [Sphingomonadaceae bacterium]